MLDLDALPPEIVPALEALATALATHIRAHPDAPLSTHEDGVQAAWEGARGVALTGVVQAATTGVTNPHRPTRPVRAACPGCGHRARPQSRRGRARTVLTRLGPITLERPWHHCRACRAGWSPADRTLGLAPRQRTSAGLQRWEALLGARLPFAESRRVLAELTGLELGVETVRAHAEAIGARAAATEQAAIAHVLATQDPPPDRYAPVPAEQRLVIETDGVLIRYRGSGWHEVKVAEVAGCVLGTGRARDDPAYRAPRLVGPSYTAAREPSDGFDARLLALAAERGALDLVGYEQPPGTDPRLVLRGPHLGRLRPVVLLADGAPWIWALAARCFGDDRVEIVDLWHGAPRGAVFPRGLRDPPLVAAATGRS